MTMKKYYKNKIYIALLSVMLIVITISPSCKKFVTLPLPDTQIPAETIFSDSTSLNAGLNGVYDGLANSTDASNNAFIQPSMFADELISSSTSNAAAQKNSYTPDNDYRFFTAYYVIIYRANAILAGLDKATNVSIAFRNQTKGECLFLRAFSYFQLVNFYGGVPLYTGTDIQANAYLAKSPTAAVYQQIITDLTNAVPLLSDSYVVAARTRANKETANALLARTYLYTKDYAKAIIASSAVINSGLYTLNTNVNNVFLASSNETIFQLWNVGGTALASYYVTTAPSAVFAYTVQPGLANSFEVGDTRKTAWLKAGTGTQASNYYPYKWKAKSGVAAANAEYPIEFRLAEMYLIRAEARAQTNDVSSGLTDVYAIRNRAGLTTPLTTVTTPAQLLTTVASERRKELSFEGGHRWFDLNRTGQTVTVLAPLKPGIDAHSTLLPFPLTQLNFNPNLVQNPGY